MQNRLKIAMYLRLSKEDDRNTQESNSISCQRLLLKEYIEQNFRGEILSDEVCPPKACITACPDRYTLSDEGMYYGVPGWVYLIRRSLPAEGMYYGMPVWV